MAAAQSARRAAGPVAQSSRMGIEDAQRRAVTAPRMAMVIATGMAAERRGPLGGAAIRA
jgi:hypothetical protein